MEEKRLRIIPLGGLGEIGLNMLVLEYGEEIVVIDCGLMFPEDHMLGVDYVIPDVSYLEERKERVRAYLITHGHEDHTGGLPFILKSIPAPLYGTRLTLGLINEKLREHNLDGLVEMKEIVPGMTEEIGCFHVEPISVSHSIVDGVAFAITTPVGIVIHTGDFKLDRTPVDGVLTDCKRFSYYGDRGVLLLLSDSTNVEREGFTPSEKEVGLAFREAFKDSSGKIVIATFSSNIQRVQQVIDVSHEYRRKVFLTGRSMIANVKIASELGYLNIPEGLVQDIKELNGIPQDQITILTTGSQGEPLSALARMAMDEHKQIRIERGDTVILSARLIPGHERAIGTLINHLYRRGARVLYESVSETHVSGHASKGELQAMIEMVRPRFFMPVHGEYRHLVMHGELAMRAGIPERRIVIAEDGDIVEVTDSTIEIAGRALSGKVFVDGKGVGDIGDMVLKDRLHLSRDGIVIPIVAINEDTGEIIYGPDIVSRGFVFEEESGELLSGARDVVLMTLEDVNLETRTEWLEVKAEIRRALRRFFNKAIDRRPVIFPLIIEI